MDLRPSPTVSPTVDIYQLDGSAFDDDHLNALLRYLPPAEQARKNQIGHPQARRNFVLGRAVLRSRLSQVVGLLPSELAIGTGPHGKPGLISDPAVQFNLSHGGDWLVVALSIRHSLGVDLEPIQPRRNLPGLCRRYLSDREAHTVLAQPSRYQAEHFLRHWTCKEAYVKGLGIGLTQTLTTLDLTPSDRPLPPHPTPLTQAQGLAPGWRLYQWQPTAGYVAAIAIHQPTPPPPTIQLNTLSPQSL